MGRGLAGSGPKAAEGKEAGKTKTGSVRPPPKNIVLCSDGTGNQGGKGQGTNVWRLYNYLDRAPPGRSAAAQVAFYDDGVGSQDNKILKLIGGAFGLGLSRNIRQLYAYLVQNYTPGDRIYLFGFSRGAYTVRILAGMITTCGVLDKAKFDDPQELHQALRNVFRCNRQRYGSLFDRLSNRLHGVGAAMQDFTDQDMIHRPVPVHFLGAWDTVDAVGLPIYELAYVWDLVFRHRFPDRRLSAAVRHARHALAIDDERRTFHPVMWDEKGSATDVAQVWFAGNHANVGGGYPKQGMSYPSLHWMMCEASQTRQENGAPVAGLRFLASAWDEVKDKNNVNDKLYDSRAGLAAYYRYRPRDIDAICEENCATGAAALHASALTRLAQATGGYAPANFPRRFTLVEDPLQAPLDLTDVDRLKAALVNEGTARPLFEARRWVKPRRVLYGALLGYSGFLLWLTLFGRWGLPEAFSWTWLCAKLKALGQLLFDFPQSLIVNLYRNLADQPWLLVAVGLVSVLLFFLRYRWRKATKDAAGRFWRRNWPPDPKG